MCGAEGTNTNSGSNAWLLWSWNASQAVTFYPRQRVLCSFLFEMQAVLLQCLLSTPLSLSLSSSFLSSLCLSLALALLCSRSRFTPLSPPSHSQLTSIASLLSFSLLVSLPPPPSSSPSTSPLLTRSLSLSFYLVSYSLTLTPISHS